MITQEFAQAFCEKQFGTVASVEPYICSNFTTALNGVVLGNENDVYYIGELQINAYCIFSDNTGSFVVSPNIKALPVGFGVNKYCCADYANLPQNCQIGGTGAKTVNMNMSYQGLIWLINHYMSIYGAVEDAEVYYTFIGFKVRVK